jgi:hypothetical protein
MPRICLLLCTLFSAVSAFATLQFNLGGFPVNMNPNWITLGDFNRDGRPDIAFSAGNTVDIYLNAGNGAYTFKSSYPTTSSSQVETADLNGDGKLDLIVASDIRYHLWTFLGIGDGTFTPGPTINTPGVVFEVEPAALITAGIPDLVTRECAPTSVSCAIRVYRNLGGSFTTGATVVPWNSQVLQYPTGTRALVTMDLNRDGKTDLGYARKDGFDVLPGKGNGTFGASKHYTVANGLSSLTVGSLRKNTSLDLIADGPPSSCSETVCPQTAQAFLNDGTGKFTLKSKNQINGEYLVAGDLNGDLFADVLGLEGSLNFGDLEYLAGHGNGYFNPAVSIGTPSAANTPVLRDMNGDGREDILYPGELGDVAILTNINANVYCVNPNSSSLQAKICSSASSSAGVWTVRGSGNSPAGVVRLELYLDGT